jgi:hypothetical protein
MRYGKREEAGTVSGRMSNKNRKQRNGKRKIKEESKRRIQQLYTNIIVQPKNT